MKVFCAGLGRTGTTSLTMALRELGYSAVHFDRSFAARFKAARDSVELDLSDYEDLDVLSDLPTAVYYREFLQAFPDVKVILTVRDEDKWWASMRRHLKSMPLSGPNDHSWGWKWPQTTWLGRLVTFGVSYPHEFQCRKRYREHNEDVQRVVPEDQLLVMDITAGDDWEVLCPFLDKRIPDEPFPYLNRSAGKRPKPTVPKDLKHQTPGTTYKQQKKKARQETVRDEKRKAKDAREAIERDERRNEAAQRKLQQKTKVTVSGKNNDD